MGYRVNGVKYVIPGTRDRITITCDLTYNDTYTLSSYDIHNKNLGYLSDFIKSITPSTDSTFTALFNSNMVSDSFSNYSSDRLKSTSKSIPVGGTNLEARLNDIVAFKLLNMASEATVNISYSSIKVTSYNTYEYSIPNDKDLHNFVDQITGGYTDGFLYCDVLPVKIESVTYGNVNQGDYSLNSNNIPAHVYFGVLGDIRFIQISDENLHTQYNYIKERLGMPWTDDQGNLDYDYYTPETYNENNPTAINLSNFLGYLRTGRYNQIKNSLINEATVSNKYFWLYMKFHKEFGCDQRANLLKDAIEKGETDLSTLSQIL